MKLQLNRIGIDSQHVRGGCLAILILMLIVVAAAHYNLHKDTHLNGDPRAVLRWYQPAALDGKFSYPVANDYWRFDYTQLEKILWEASVDPSGKLLINSETADLLARAIALLPEEVSLKDRQRLTFLIEKSWPVEGGQQLGELLNSYYLYHQEYRSYLSTINSAEGDRKLGLLRASKSRYRQSQQKYFDLAVAEKLFSKKNKITDYLNDRRIVNLDQALTQSQKQQRLSALRESYQESNKNTVTP